MGEALQKNIVRPYHSPHSCHLHLLLFIQTLTALDLSENQIGEKGAQYVGEALAKNKVRQYYYPVFLPLRLVLFI